MTDKNKTLIAALLDRSGSMGGNEKSTEDGFNELINGQKAEPGTAVVTLAQFDDKYEVVYQNRPIGEVPSLTLQPRGMTAMNDAIGKLVTDVGAELAGLKEEERPGLVIVVIMTDGLENASREWNAESVKKLIKEQETTYGWKFIFLGSGIDVRKESAQRGMSAARSMQFDVNAPGAVAAAYSSTSSMIGQLRGMASAGLPEAAMDAVAYSDEDRAAAIAAQPPGRQDGEDNDAWKDRLKTRGVVGSSK